MLIVTNVRNTFDNEQSQLLKIVKKRKLPPSARPGCYIQTTKKGSITASPKKYQPLAVSYLLVSPIGITAKALPAYHRSHARPDGHRSARYGQVRHASHGESPSV